jgi:predicted metal-dependent hydrolase
LAPELEDQDDRVIAAVVAHELAHVIIGDVFGREYEAKADALVSEWGFASELDELRKVNPNHRY